MVDSHARIDLEGLEGCDDGNGVSAKIHRGLASLCIRPVKTDLVTVRTLARGVLSVRLNPQVCPVPVPILPLPSKQRIGGHFARLERPWRG